MAARGYFRRWAYIVERQDGVRYYVGTECKAIAEAKKCGGKAYENDSTYRQVWPVARPTGLKENERTMITQKAIKTKLMTTGDVYPDKITCKADGSVEVRKSFFYRFDMSAEKWGEKVMAVVGDDAQLVKTVEDNNRWPKTSYFVAVVKGV